jgi:hypothetical protein
VAAIEKLIGQPIPVMEKLPGPPLPPQHRVAEKPHGHHHAGRKGPLVRSEEQRVRRPPPSPRSRHDDSDASHLPAFLLRPVKI